MVCGCGSGEVAGLSVGSSSWREEKKVKEEETWGAEVLVQCGLFRRLTSNVNRLCNFGQDPSPV